MAVTISRYNHTVDLLLGGEVDFANIKAMLLDSNASFTAAHTAINSVSNTGAYEVDGNGWTTGGETLSGVASTVVATNGAMFDADDVSVTATGGGIGPADAAVLYDATSGKPLWFIDFGGSETALEGRAFELIFNASGIARATGA